MTPGLRRVIKPAIEVMGALPTVVIGLVAGIWLAPIIEQYLLAVLALPLLLAAAVLLCGALTHRFMPRCRPGVDLLLLLLLPLLALTVWLALSLGPRLEVALFGEPLHFWLGIVRPAQCAGGGRGDGLRAGADHLLAGGGRAVQRAGHPEPGLFGAGRPNGRR